MYTLRFATLAKDDNLLYLGQKLVIEDPSIEGGNFVSEDESYACLGFGSL